MWPDGSWWTPRPAEVHNRSRSLCAGPANDPKGRVDPARPGRDLSLTRKLIDEYGNFVKICGAKGLAILK